MNRLERRLCDTSRKLYYSPAPRPSHCSIRCQVASVSVYRLGLPPFDTTQPLCSHRARRLCLVGRGCLHCTEQRPLLARRLFCTIALLRYHFVLRRDLSRTSCLGFFVPAHCLAQPLVDTSRWLWLSPEPRPCLSRTCRQGYSERRCCLDSRLWRTNTRLWQYLLHSLR